MGTEDAFQPDPKPLDPRPIELRLGRITRAEYGLGSYQEAQFGLSLYFESDSGWSAQWFSGAWADDPSPDAKWTLADQSESFAQTTRTVRDTLRAAKVESVSALVGIPVATGFRRGQVESWRILTEVL